MRLSFDRADKSSTMQKGTNTNPRMIPSNNFSPVVKGVGSANDRIATSNAIVMKDSNISIMISIDHSPRSPSAYQPSFEKEDVPSGGGLRNFMLNWSCLQRPKISLHRLLFVVWPSSTGDIVSSLHAIGVSARRTKYSRASQSCFMQYTFQKAIKNIPKTKSKRPPCLQAYGNANIPVPAAVFARFIPTLTTDALPFWVASGPSSFAIELTRFIFF
mmetsp:Transcript_22959/g.50029  ORF Transcript_22959/g.50029 Transcript_22959/m.50029 type:complete len:216 (-) Transcript_22959:51-698(-)